jgi:hypothetical protein
MITLGFTLWSGGFGGDNAGHVFQTGKAVG